MNYILIGAFVLLVCFYDLFALVFHFTLIDEIIAVLFMLYAGLIKIMVPIKLSKLDKKIFLSTCFLLLVGIISSFQENQPFRIMAMDAIIFIKFFIIYFSVRIILLYKQFNYKVTKNILRVLVIIFSIIAIMTLYDRSFAWFPTFDHKYFNIGSEQLFFGHPSRFAFINEMLLLLLLPFLKKNNYFFIFFILISIVGLLSLRTKYIIFILVFFLAILFLKTIKNLSFSKILPVVLLLVISIPIIFHNEIVSQLTIREDGTEGVRGLLFVSGIDIAINNFPFGAGFGSFGSFASTVNYSPLYYIYHFNIIPGCMPDKPSFLADNFYAMLLGEFGFVGLALFLYVLFLFTKFFITAYNKDNSNKYYYASGIIMIIMIFYESISDSILTQNRGAFIAIYLAYIVTKFDLYNRVKND